MSHPAKSNPSHKISRWTLLLLVLPLLLACGMPQSSIPATPQTTDASGAATAEERAMGDPNAPVTLIEYGDYQ